MLALTAAPGAPSHVDLREIEVVDLALRIHGAPLYVRHAIVHNEWVVRSFERRGVIFVESIDDIPEGMTVFLGENEAGKSTLLDFVRGVLFGFPDRRNKALFHEPLRGGRHGGPLEFIEVAVPEPGPGQVLAPICHRRSIDVAWPGLRE